MRVGLFLSTSLLAMIAPALAQAEGTELDPVVVVADRTPQPLSKVAVTVTVLDQETIKASQAIDLSDLLQTTPGIALSRAGGPGQPTSLFIRGADSAQTLVLIDGVPINDPSQPSAGFDFANLLTSDISRVEILRGAHSTLWGSQAIGGVVDIITTPPSKAPQVDLTAEVGARETRNLVAGASGTSGPFSLRLAGGYYTTAGIPAFDERLGGVGADGTRDTSFSGRATYQLSPTASLELRGYYVDAWVAFDGYDTPTGQFGNDHEFAKTQQYIVYSGLNLENLDGRLKSQLSIQYADTDHRLFDPGPGRVNLNTIETYYGLGSTTRLEYHGDLKLSPESQLVFGASHERSNIVTDSPAEESAPAPLRAHMSLDSAYGQAERTFFHALTLTGGVRYDHSDSYGGHVTGETAAVLSLNDGATRIRTSFGQGFKVPALYQQFSPYGPLAYQQPALKPEQSNSWEFGVEQHFWSNRGVVSATYFGRATRDLIQFYYGNPQAPYGLYDNVGRASAEGLELQGQLKPLAGLTLTANYTFDRARDDTNHVALARRPKSVGNFEASYVWPTKFTTTLAARLSGSAPDQGYDSNFNPIAITLKAYTVVDLRASYPIGSRLEVFGRIENLFNQHYETAYLYGSPGYGAFAGLRARF